MTEIRNTLTPADQRKRDDEPFYKFALKRYGYDPQRIYEAARRVQQRALEKAELGCGEQPRHRKFASAGLARTIAKTACLNYEWFEETRYIDVSRTLRSEDCDARRMAREILDSAPIGAELTVDTVAVAEPTHATYVKVNDATWRLVLWEDEARDARLLRDTDYVTAEKVKKELGLGQAPLFSMVLEVVRLDYTRFGTFASAEPRADLVSCEEVGAALGVPVSEVEDLAREAGSVLPRSLWPVRISRHTYWARHQVATLASMMRRAAIAQRS